MAIIGIDLGTTNSLVSIWRHGKAELIPNSLGTFLTPSVVSMDKDGTLWTGTVAREKMHTQPERSAASFKSNLQIIPISTIIFLQIKACIFSLICYNIIRLYLSQGVFDQSSPPSAQRR